MAEQSQFMPLFLQNERRLYALILGLVHNWADADDVMQETCSVLWQKFGEFQAGTNFTAWAMQTAYLQALNHRKRKRSRLSEETMQALLNRFAALPDPRREVLGSCLGKLPEHDRELVQLRYEPGANVETVAQAVGRSVHAVYKALSRIHRQLYECVHRTLKSEGA